MLISRPWPGATSRSRAKTTFIPSWANGSVTHYCWLEEDGTHEVGDMGAGGRGPHGLRGADPPLHRCGRRVPVRASGLPAVARGGRALRHSRRPPLAPPRALHLPHHAAGVRPERSSIAPHGPHRG